MKKIQISKEFRLTSGLPVAHLSLAVKHLVQMIAMKYLKKKSKIAQIKTLTIKINRMSQNQMMRNRRKSKKMKARMKKLNQNLSIAKSMMILKNNPYRL